MAVRWDPEYFDRLERRLASSRFRSSFHLSARDQNWVLEKGMEKVEADALDIVEKRLAGQWPKNDGKQTPFKGHPVFVAQHATGCCCRGCLEKWHSIPRGKPLNAFEKQYIVHVLCCWIAKQTETAQKGEGFGLKD